MSGNKSSDGKVSDKLHKIIAGDKGACKWLYETFAARLFRRLKNRYEKVGLNPDDLLHDAFLFFFRKQAKVLGNFLERVPRNDHTEARLERYLWDLACGIASNQRRSHASRKVVPITESQDFASGYETEQFIISRALLIQLKACLKKKDPRLYLYYKLRHQLGLSAGETAKVTGWPVKTTYNLKSSLEKAIRECAEELGIFKNEK